MGFTFPGNPFASPNIVVALVMFAWLPFVLYLFSTRPARKAVVLSFVAGWLFLPVAELVLPGIPDYNKMSATCYGILLATFMFDVGRFSSFRFSWVDAPMAVWCLCPIASSLANGLGLYDGVAAALDQSMTWGAPYFLGRLYCGSLDGLRELAKAIFIGGLIYVPLCLYEIRLSPQLHRMVYGGFASGDFAQTMRLGGFRPTVFMNHGLEVGAFMMAATLIGFWFWQTGAVKQVWGIPMPFLVAALFGTLILTRSTGAYVLFGMGVAILLVAKYLKTALPVFLMVIAIAVYLYINALTETYFSDQLINYLSDIFPADRVSSLEFRFNNEELLSDKARQQPIFGWSGWGRSLIFDETGRQITVQDSLWIIAFGINGIVGMISLFAAMLLPIASLYWIRYPARLWQKPRVASAAVLGIVILLYMADCLMNAMINPLYILGCGGVAGAILNREKITQASKPQQVGSARLVPRRLA